MRRRLAGGIVLLLLALPAAGSLPLVQWNLHVWRRLRTAGRVAPDHARDLEYRRLVAHLPPSGTIGLLRTAAGDPEEATRLLYSLQYALAPRTIAFTTDADFVIAIAWPSPDTVLLPTDSFAIVTALDSGLQVYRRIPR